MPPPTDAFGDVDEAGDWVTSLLDVTLEAVDDALADAKRAGEAAAASAAPQPWLPPGAGAGAGPASAATTKASPAGAAAGRGRGGGDGFVSYMESQLQRRPQESFDDPVDNSRAPFVHRLDSLAEVVDVEVAAAAAAAAAAAGEAPPHPLADRLAALQYPGWQLEAGEARPPKDLEETPFTYIDTLPALRAAGKPGWRDAMEAKDGRRGRRPEVGHPARLDELRPPQLPRLPTRWCSRAAGCRQGGSHRSGGAQLPLFPGKQRLPAGSRGLGAQADSWRALGPVPAHISLALPTGFRRLLHCRARPRPRRGSAASCSSARAARTSWSTRWRCARTSVSRPRPGLRSCSIPPCSAAHIKRA